MNPLRRICTQARFGLCAVLLLAAGAGCTSYEAAKVDEGWPTARPLGRDIPTYRPPSSPGEEPARDLSLEEPTGIITLREALAQALLKSPELAAFGWEVRSAEARILQAGAIPNPELEAAIEEFGGSGARRGFSGSEATLQLSQLIELGGKREKRTRVAELERDLAGWEYETKRLDVLTQTAQAFVEVVAAQRNLALAENILDLSQRFAEAVSERVKAGQVSPLEQARAEVVASTSRMDLERAQKELARAREQLAAAWGSTSSSFSRAEGGFEEIADLPPRDELLERSAQNPDFARWTTEMALRRAAIDLEKARTVPDVTIGAGVRRYAETDDDAFLVGLSIPIPVFGLNPGGVREATSALAQARENRRASEVAVRTALGRTYLALSAAHREILALRGEVLPAANEAFDAARQGYREGKFNFLQVIDAQRTLFEARGRYVDALTEYHKLKATLERLIGGPLVPAQSPSDLAPTGQEK